MTKNLDNFSSISVEMATKIWRNLPRGFDITYYLLPLRILSYSFRGNYYSFLNLEILANSNISIFT